MMTKTAPIYEPSDGKKGTGQETDLSWPVLAPYPPVLLTALVIDKSLPVSHDRPIRGAVTTAMSFT